MAMRWVVAGVVLALAVLVLLPAITAAGRKLKSYFNKDVVEEKEKDDGD